MQLLSLIVGDVTLDNMRYFGTPQWVFLAISLISLFVVGYCLRIKITKGKLTNVQNLLDARAKLLDEREKRVEELLETIEEFVHKK